MKREQRYLQALQVSQYADLMEELMNAFSIPGQVLELEDGGLSPPHSPPDLQQGAQACLWVAGAGTQPAQDCH